MSGSLSGRERERVKSDWFNNRVVSPLVLGLRATDRLTVRGRRTGAERTLPLHVLEVDGERYLVAPRGEVEWVQNIRAAGEAVLRRRGRAAERIGVEEITGPERARLVALYRERWGREVVDFWARLPRPEQHPVFRVIRK
jgi:deazaflavin-dependent oxidoreductase (nitroreductase family)